MLFNKTYIFISLLLATNISPTLFMAADNIQPDVILVSEDNPPYVYANREEQYVGTSIDYLIPILNNAKLTFEIRIAPWKRAMSLVQRNNHFLIYPISRIPEREDDFNWLLPLHSMNFKLFGLASKVDVNLNDVKSGQYKFVCANHTIQCLGLSKLGIPDDAIVRISNVDDIQMSQMVMRERVDFMLITERGLHHQLIVSKVDPKVFVALENYNYEVVEYLAGSKNFDKSLAERIVKSAEQHTNHN